MNEAEKDNPTVIVASFSLTTPMPNQSSLVISGHFYNKDDPKEIHSRLDQWADIAKRQFERSSIELREAGRKQHLANLENIKKSFEALAAKVRDGAKLSTMDRQKFENGQQSVKAATEQLAQIDDGIAEAKKKVGMTG